MRKLTPTPTPSPVESVVIPTPEGGATEQWHRAVDLLHQAVALQFQGRLSQAIKTYQQSIATYPTAEAYTFLGWTYNWMGENGLAISEAKKAIELDPDFGNPYNDIGAILVEMGGLDEAIPWLKKAMAAKRYEPRHFPHLNLGKIWVSKGRWNDALDSFEEALRLAPEQPLRPLPRIAVSIPPPGVDTPKPSEAAVDDLLETMAGYFQAWNTYDPAALVESTTPSSVETTKALLLQLARVKLEQSKIRLVDTDIIYFGEDMAILGTRLLIDGRTFLVPHLLALYDGEWKVVGRAFIRAEGEA